MSAHLRTSQAGPGVISTILTQPVGSGVIARISATGHHSGWPPSGWNLDASDITQNDLTPGRTKVYRHPNHLVRDSYARCKLKSWGLTALRGIVRGIRDQIETRIRDLITQLT